MGGGGINVFRSSDIQAYTPPANKPKAAEPETTPPPAKPDDNFAALGDLKKYDTDGNGKITKDEFNATRGGELLRAKAEQEKDLFKKLDANGDGKLSSDEFLRAFSQLTGDGTVAKVRDHIDGEFNQRKAADGTIHVDPKVQAGGGDTKPKETEKPKEAEKPKETGKTEKADDKKDTKTETKDYTVKGGDTLGKIAKAHGISLKELKEANPELFKAGKDAGGKHRTAGGDLIYPGDKIKIPTKAEKKDGAGGGGDKPKALDEKDAVKFLQDNFDKVAGPDGQVTRGEIAAKVPDGPGKDALLKHFDSLIFAKIDEGKAAFSNLTKGDVEEIGKKLGEAGSLDKVADGLTQQIIKDRGIKDSTGDGKVDAADLAAYVKANGGSGPLDTNQAKVIANLNERLASLKSEKDKLAKDLNDPNKKAEAQARMNLLDMQMAALTGIRNHVSAYQTPANQSPEEQKKIGEIFGMIDGIAKDVGNPQQMGSVKSRLTAAYNLLENPKLYDPSAPGATTDPAVQKQSMVVQHLNDKVTGLVNEMTNTVKDLADPAKQKEAQARLEQLKAQIDYLTKLSGQVEDFRRTASMTPDQVKQAADLLQQIDGQIGNLSDPKKLEQARTDVQGMLNKLNQRG